MNYVYDTRHPCCTGCGDETPVESLSDDAPGELLCPGCAESYAAELREERERERWDEEHGGDMEPRWAF